MGNQKRIGNEFEKKLGKLLQNNGYWCHIFAYNQSGQPCDIIATKEDKTFLIDVKHCTGDRFSFDRIESNQHTCFQYAISCGVKYVGFAIWFDSDNCFKWLPYYSCDSKYQLKSVQSESLINFEEYL